jgi:hypothetical protein
VPDIPCAGSRRQNQKKLPLCSSIYFPIKISRR